jgi:protein involved in polysaccharide export with SLBB domain
MPSGQGRRSWWRRAALAGLPALVAGCLGPGGHIDRALLADHNPAAHQAGAAARYCVHCPDVLDVTVPGHPDCCGQRPVSADGRIPLGDAALRVDGLTPEEVARRAASVAGVAPGQVQVRVTAFNSQQVFLCGEVAGLPRALPYQGPETVVDLLQRAGGLAPGAAPDEVQVVRSHVADGTPPEVFHVDLEAILLRGEQQTNVLLEPFDQVYVGQTRRSCVAGCLPPWVRRVAGWFGG